MKTYLLNVKTYDYIDETEDEYIEVFSNFERAKNYGLEFFNKELQFYCKYINRTIKQAKMKMKRKTNKILGDKI